MTVEIIALVEKNYGQKILEEMNSSPGVLQILNAAGRSDDLFDNKQFGTFGEAAIVTIVADDKQKEKARTEYENMMYVERPGCNLCMGNQEKAEKGDTVMATSTRLFKGRVVADSDRKKGESLLASTPVVVLSAILGRTPTIKEYVNAVQGINLTKFSPPKNKLCA